MGMRCRLQAAIGSAPVLPRLQQQVWSRDEILNSLTFLYELNID